MKLENRCLIQALRREPADRRPVWLMRQAGRYLPEYRELRSRAGSFLALLKTPELAAEATLQPVNRFDLDAAIQFADILTIPDAMGLGLDFRVGEGPHFRQRIARAGDVSALPVLDPERDLDYVLAAIKASKRELSGRLPLIGFAGGPWTLAAYMLEGGAGGGSFPVARAATHADPVLVDRLVSRLGVAIAAYLTAQAHAGADVLMLFESWAGLLDPPGFRRYLLDPMAEIITGIKADTLARHCPLIVFPRGAAQHLVSLAALDLDALGLDWTVPLGTARTAVGAKVALQGNLDPAALYAPEPRLRAAIRALCAEYGPGPGHIFNLGHGISPDVRPESVAVLVDEVHQH